MTYPRRTILAALASCLSACVAPQAKPPPRSGFDTARLLSGFPALAQRAHPGLLAVGVRSLPDGLTWMGNAVAPLPLQSVFKAPLAAACLDRVDQGRMRLNTTVRVPITDLSPPGSPINEAFNGPEPPAHLTLRIADLIALMVQRSDNTAADTMLELIGGPDALNAWLASHQISGMRIDRSERVLQQDIAGMPPFRSEWRTENAWHAARDSVPAADRESAMRAYLADVRDTTTIGAALDFLTRLDQGALLSATSTTLLLRLMTNSTTGTGRLLAGLPRGTRLAHKTGTASTDLGLTPATNDIGIATLPNGRRFAVAAFLVGSTATASERDQLIADSAALIATAFG